MHELTYQRRLACLQGPWPQVLSPSCLLQRPRTAPRGDGYVQHMRERKVAMKHPLWKARACMVFVQRPLRLFHTCNCSSPPQQRDGHTGSNSPLRCDDTARSGRDGASPTLKLRSYACPNVTASLWICAQVRCMAVRCTHHKRSADRRGLAEVARFTRSSHGTRHQPSCPHPVWCSATSSSRLKATAPRNASKPSGWWPGPTRVRCAEQELPSHE